jgi:hypothetical protein
MNSSGIITKCMARLRQVADTNGHFCKHLLQAVAVRRE